TSLERTEALEPALAQARAQVEVMSGALEKTRTRVNHRQHEFTAQLNTLNAEREVLRPLIEPEWLTRFDRISNSRGTGVARVDNQQCIGCRMGVRPQMWNQLREGQVLTCDSCGRILYWDPAMAPAPKVPQPEAVPGAGRAPRKPAPQAPKRSLNIPASFYSIFELSVNTTSGTPSIPRPLRNGWDSKELHSTIERG